MQTLRLFLTMMTMTVAIGSPRFCLRTTAQGNRDRHSASKQALNQELISFAAHGLKEKVLRTLEEGADINAKDELGLTALMQAAREGKREMVGLLLERGA